MNQQNLEVKAEWKRTEIEDLINISNIKRCIMMDIIILTLLRAGDKIKSL